MLSLLRGHGETAGNHPPTRRAYTASYRQKIATVTINGDAYISSNAFRGVYRLTSVDAKKVTTVGGFTDPETGASYPVVRIGSAAYRNTTFTAIDTTPGTGVKVDAGADFSQLVFSDWYTLEGTISGVPYSITLPGYVYTRSTESTLTLRGAARKLAEIHANENYAECYTTPDALYEENTKFQTIDGALYSKDGSVLFIYPRSKTAPDATFRLPETVTHIAAEAFYGVTTIRTMYVSGPIHIDYRAFASTSNLTSIHFASEAPSVFFGRDIFSGADANLMLYVPDGYVEAYRENIWLNHELYDKIAVWSEPPQNGEEVPSDEPASPE